MTDSKNSTKSGRSHEILGSFDLENDKKQINADRVKYWISKGAKPSDTIHNFLIEKKIIPGKKVNALPKRTPVKKESEVAPTLPPTANVGAPTESVGAVV